MFLRTEEVQFAAWIHKAQLTTAYSSISTKHNRSLRKGTLAPLRFLSSDAGEGDGQQTAWSPWPEPWRQVQNRGKPCPDGPDSRENERIWEAPLRIFSWRCLRHFCAAYCAHFYYKTEGFFLSNKFIRMPEAKTSHVSGWNEDLHGFSPVECGKLIVKRHQKGISMAAF
jgi:hypothetical protein